MIKYLLSLALVTAGIGSTTLLTSKEDYSAIQDDTYTQVKNKKFQEFLGHFPKGSLPYKIDALTELTNYDEAKSAANNYADENASNMNEEAKFRVENKYGKFVPEIERGLYSRMGPEVARYEAILASNDNYHIVVYSLARSFTSKNRRTYRLVSYDNDGNQLANVFLAAKGTSNSCTNGEITKDLQVTVTRYYTKFDTQTNSYPKPTAKDIDETVTYHISKSGQILRDQKNDEDQQQQKVELKNSNS